MAFKWADRVKETTQTTGTGSLDLDGAATGYRAFSDELSDADETVYLIVDDPDSPSEYEIGVGTLTTGSPDSLSRDTVLDSSNGGAKVNLQSGTTYSVIATIAAARLAYLNSGGTLPSALLPTNAANAITALVDDTTPQLGGDLDLNGQGFDDTNGNEMLVFSVTGSAVNHIQFTNAATGNGPDVAAAGDDTNIDLNITPKGTGAVVLGGPLKGNRVTANMGFTPVTDTSSSGSVTFDFSTGNKVEITLTENITSITLSGATAGDDLKIRITQDSTARTVSGWPAAVKWSGGGTAPTISTTSGAVDIVYLDYDGTNYWASIEQDFQ